MGSRQFQQFLKVCKMSKENRAKLIEALRSGKFSQTHMQLKNRAGEHCCLGVACELSNLGKFFDRFYTIENGLNYYYYSPPPEVTKWLGLDKEKIQTLVNLNDLDRRSFKEIADVIESWEIKDAT
jgi:hypothetical protein